MSCSDCSCQSTWERMETDWATGGAPPGVAWRAWMATLYRCPMNSSPRERTHPSPCSDNLCIKFCLPMKCPQTIQTADCDTTFHWNLIYEKACWLLAKHWAFQSLDQNSSHTAASNPKQPAGQGDRSPEVLMKGLMRWGQEWMKPWGAQETLTPLSCPPAQPSCSQVRTFPSLSHPRGSVAYPLTLSPRVCPTWLDESGAGREGHRLCPGLDSWLLPTLEHVTLPLWVLIYNELWSRFKTMQVRTPYQCLPASVNVIFTHMLVCSHYQPLHRAGSSNHTWNLESTTIKCCSARRREGVSSVLNTVPRRWTWFLQSPYHMQQHTSASLTSGNGLAKELPMQMSSTVTWPLNRRHLVEAKKERLPTHYTCIQPTVRAPLNYPLFTWLGK